jgi:hypothetical protein
MSDKKPNPLDFTSDILIADIMLRITAIEKLLIDKGLFTQKELIDTTEEIAKRIAKVVLEKVSLSKNLDEFITSLETDAKDGKNYKN